MTSFTIESIQFHVLPTHTRFPFRYGIASMEALPHLFVSANLVVNGKAQAGLASDGLAPKWFTKDPDTLFEQDLAEMLAVIQNAGRIGRHAAASSTGFYPWWRALYDEQTLWATHCNVPPLLAHFGTSLIERAVLDALCKALGQPLHQVLKSEALGIQLGDIRPVLRGMTLSQILPPEPLAAIHVRHTIGLADPLSASDVPPGEAIDDGLPYTLEENIRAYRLRYFKIKVSGKLDADRDRLHAIAAILDHQCPDGYHCTFDGNEQFHQMAEFQDYYQTISTDPALRRLFASLLLVEQPIHRAHALDDSVAGQLAAWHNGPAIIIDESDGSLADLPRAIALGYRGTSHKNCKGITKSLANAALLRHHGLNLLSGEDLASIGPVAMLQDLAVAAAMGIRHVERNGHHYFAGLSMYPASVQADALRVHSGFYTRHARGFPTLQIQDGQLDVTTLNAAPFACGIILPLDDFEPLSAWIKRGGMSET